MKQAGQIVVFRFPQTDLEEGKLRPALLLGRLPGYLLTPTPKVGMLLREGRFSRRSNPPNNGGTFPILMIKCRCGELFAV
jgi:hypothetical protein